VIVDKTHLSQVSEEPVSHSANRFVGTRRCTGRTLETS
jgi:hypothetical protein